MSVVAVDERARSWTLGLWLIPVAAGIASLAVLTLLRNDEAVASTLGRATPSLVIAALLFTGVAFYFHRTGLPILIALVYLNLSQALVRYHEFPSLLQFLVIALAFASWLHRDTEPVREVVRQPVTLFAAAYLIVLLATTTFAVDRSLADERAAEMCKAFILYLLATSLMRDRLRVSRGVHAMMLAASVLAVLVIVQVVTGDFDQEFGGLARIKHAHIYGDVFQPRIAGPIGDPNFFAQILLIPIPVAVIAAWLARRRLHRALYFAAAALIVVTLLVTYSRGAMLALGVMGTLLIATLHISWYRTVAAILLVALVLVLLPSSVTERLITIEEIFANASETLHPDSSIQERRLLMTVAWIMFGANPLLGVGVGNYSARYEDYVSAASSSARQYADPSLLHFPHNLYLEIAAESGVVGLVLFAFLAISCFLALNRGARRFEDRDVVLYATARGLQIAFVGFLVSSLFLHLAFPRYLWILFAFAAALERLARRDELSAGAPASGS